MLGSAPCGPAGALLPPSIRPGRALAATGRARALRGSAAFAVDRNISYFLWYGGVAGEGLRSVGAGGELPNHELVFYPAHRPPFTGRGIPRVVPAFACLAKMCRSADASSAGGAYGVFLGRQGVSSLYLGVPALPMLAAPLLPSHCGAAFALPMLHGVVFGQCPSPRSDAPVRRPGPTPRATTPPERLIFPIIPHNRGVALRRSRPARTGSVLDFTQCRGYGFLRTSQSPSPPRRREASGAAPLGGVGCSVAHGGLGGSRRRRPW